MAAVLYGGFSFRTTGKDHGDGALGPESAKRSQRVGYPVLLKIEIIYYTD